ncbi:hypothetical protein P9112_012753 [Eukaryota sp. TZLM1-RC]
MQDISHKLDDVIRYLKSIDASLASPKASVTETQTSAPTVSSQADLPPSVKAWDEMVSPKIQEACDLATKVNPIVEKNTKHLKTAFDAVRGLILYASQHKAPKDSELVNYFQPIISLTEGFDNPMRSDTNFSHVKALAEGSATLTWMCYKPTPVPFINDMLPSAQFHGNKIIMAARNDPSKEADMHWWKAVEAAFKAMSAYVKEHHLTGLVWNPRGEDAGAPPSSYVEGQDMSKAETTSKTEEKPKPAPKPAPKPVAGKTSTAGKKAAPPITEKDRRRWRVENHTEGHIELDDVTGGQTVSIYNCKNCTVKVNGKARNVSIERCQKVGVVFDSCIASAEVNNSKSIQLQPLGSVPIINIESTNGCRVYFNEDHVKNTEVITVASIDMNIIANVGEEPKEFNIPQQYRHVFVDGKLKTEEVIHG